MMTRWWLYLFMCSQREGLWPIRVPDHAFLAWRSSGRCFVYISNRSAHRVHTERQRPLSGVHSIMMEKLAQVGGVGGCKPTPFHSILPSRVFLCWRMYCIQWARRLEGLPYTTARLAGWRRVTRQLWLVCDGRSVPPAVSVPYRWPWQELPSCEVIEFPAAVI